MNLQLSFEQNIATSSKIFEHNRKGTKELLERKIGEKKSKIDSSL